MVFLVLLAALSISYPVAASECGAPPNMPGDAIALLRGQGQGPFDAYVIGVIVGRQASAAPGHTVRLDVRVEAVFKGSVPPTISLFTPPLFPSVEFLPRHRYLFLLTSRAGQPAGNPYGLDPCMPSVEMSDALVAEAFRAAEPITTYGEPIAPPAQSNVSLIGVLLVTVVAVSGAALAFSRRRQRPTIS